MDFLRKLLGGGAGAPGRGDIGLYFYIRPRGCQEVVRVRIDPNNDLSLEDDNRSYFVRKSVRGTTYKCTRSAELYISFGADRRVREIEVMDGEQVSEEDYTAWVATQS